MTVSSWLVAVAAAGAGLALAGCGSGGGCSSPSGPEPRRAADAYIRECVTGGRRAAAKDFASFATFVYDRLPAPVPGQNVNRVLASGERGSRTSGTMAQGFGIYGNVDPCFWYTLRAEDDRGPPYEFYVSMGCDGGRWRVSGGPAKY
jgi:hypothetical protein